MTEAFKLYRRLTAVEARPYVPGEPLRTTDHTIHIAADARVEGSPKLGDMVVRNPKRLDEMWLLTQAYFEANFEPNGPQDRDSKPSAERAKPDERPTESH